MVSWRQSAMRALSRARASKSGAAPVGPNKSRASLPLRGRLAIGNPTKTIQVSRPKLCVKLSVTLRRHMQHQIHNTEIAEQGVIAFFSRLMGWGCSHENYTVPMQL